MHSSNTRSIVLCPSGCWRLGAAERDESIHERVWRPGAQPCSRANRERHSRGIGVGETFDNDDVALSLSG